MIVNNLFNALALHPWLVGLLIIWIVLVLHLPYRYEHRRDSRGREHGVWQSVLYRYAYGSSYERLDYHGLQRLQWLIFDLLRAAWATLRGDMLRRLIDELGQRFGL